MNTKILKTIFALTAVTLFTAYGCEKKSVETESSDSSEFFKEIDNAEVQENMDQQTEALANAEAPAVEPMSGADMVTAPEKPSIKDIQQALKNANLYSGKLDGSLGPKTKTAIENFQAQNNLKVDGKVGPKTWEVLKVHFNSGAPAAVESAEPAVADPSSQGTGD